ncbi:beta-N-acetylglucosaminidase [hydrothermal vent metagenome]|uniref:beta-N-acetylhexosaminidase n=1 Tax=hydrothermal vent metagenome TaxID=652676 RepID=A0A3B0Z9Q7_9ZZZZ
MRLGPVMVGISGMELLPEEKEFLAHSLVGGVILFTRNYESRGQLTQLVRQIHTIKTPPLLVAVDHEGGRVQRFREDFTELPPMRCLGDIFDTNPSQAKQFSRDLGWLMAAELRTTGIDFSFAPVLDLDYGVSQVIGDRAFHSDADAVSSLAQSFIEGMKKAGMAATGKHFPGHGAIEADSHQTIVVDERSYVDIAQYDILPFERLIKWGLAGIMPAHVIYPKVDNQPAGFSPFWLQQELRQRLNFQGVIFSDDLEMQGATAVGGYPERAAAALSAGCDMILVCNDPLAMFEVIDNLKYEIPPESARRLAGMHGLQGQTRSELEKLTLWKQVVEEISECKK